MATTKTHRFAKLTHLLLLLAVTFHAPPPHSADARKLTALVEEQPVVLKYHKGPLLKGNTTVNLLWYGAFSAAQRSVIVDFLRSLSAAGTATPSVASWWQTTAKYRVGSSNAGLGSQAKYRVGSSNVGIGSQTLDRDYSLGKLLKTQQLEALALKAAGKGKNAVNVVVTSGGVAVDGFCMSRCGSHGSVTGKSGRVLYVWVGNAVSQCPGQCAWPFYRPVYGPQTPPLVSPNGDVGVDGVVINLATVLAGAVTNPFENGYFQGPADAPLEAVSACTGVFGSGAYPGYPGKVLVEKVSGASYNAVGVGGRRYLLPAMWDPQTSACRTLV